MSSQIRIGLTCVTRWLTKPATLLSLTLVFLFAQPGRAQTTGVPPIATHYFLTGNVDVFGLDLPGTRVNGFASAQITIPAGTIPANADPVAALLYWGTVVSKTNLTGGLVGAKFNGHDITGLTSFGASACDADDDDGHAGKIVLHRADVLPFFQRDTSGKIIVNTTHVATLPDRRNANTLGVRLLILYRTPTSGLRAIVLFEQFALPVSLSNTAIATSSFVRSLDVRWDNPTQWLTLFATTKIRTVSFMGRHGASDCWSGGAFIFSAPVKDLDDDMLPDRVEDNSTDPQGRPWGYPNGQRVPNIHAMGASSGQKDLFIEINAMKTDPASATFPGTSYGSTEHPLSSVPGGVLNDTVGHTHFPPRAVLEKVAYAYKNHGINVHFDVGNNYQSPSSAAIIPASLARGGEITTERKCDEDTRTPPRWKCQFPAYPGTVIWKPGFLAYRNAFVRDDGTELNPNVPADKNFLAAWLTVRDCRRRLDSDRKNIFHDVVLAHATGEPKP